MAKLLKSKSKIITIVALLFVIVAASVYISNLLKPKLKLLDDFPTIPVYPNAMLMSSSKDQTQTDLAFHAKWSSADGVDKITDWYLKNLPESGWEISVPPNRDIANLRYMVFRNKSNNYFNLSLVDLKDGNTEVSVDMIINQIYYD